MLQLLAYACRTSSLSRRWLEQLVDAREVDLTSTEPPPTLEWCEQYAEQTASVPIHLGLQAADRLGPAQEDAASHLGECLGLIARLRSAAVTVQKATREQERNQQRLQGQSSDVDMAGAGVGGSAAPTAAIPPINLLALGLPVDLLQDAGVRTGADASEDLDKLVPVTRAIASAAHAHLRHARDSADKVPDAVKPLFLPAIHADLFLARVLQAGFDLRDPLLLTGTAGARTSMKTAWAWFTGKY